MVRLSLLKLRADQPESQVKFHRIKTEFHKTGRFKYMSKFIVNRNLPCIC